MTSKREENGTGRTPPSGKQELKHPDELEFAPPGEVDWDAENTPPEEWRPRQKQPSERAPDRRSDEKKTRE